MVMDVADTKITIIAEAPNRQQQTIRQQKIVEAIKKMRDTLAGVPNDGVSVEERLARMLAHHGAPLVEEIISWNPSVPVDFALMIRELPTRGTDMPVGDSAGVQRDKTDFFLHNAERLFYTKSAADESKARRAMAEAHLYQSLGGRRFDATPEATRNRMIVKVVEHHKTKGINPDYDTQDLRKEFAIPLPKDITADAAKPSFLEGLTAGRGARAR